MRVLVTGGAGFIGSNFVRRVLDGSLNEISHVTVVDKLTYAGNMANLQMLDERSFEFIHGDICDTSLINRITKNIDAIVNFAAESHVDRSIAGAEDFVRTNILGTQTLLDAALRNDIKTFLQISTDEVYGTITEGSWNENFPLQPNSPYSASKASADLMALAYHRTHKLDIRITRCSNNYGPYQNPEKVIPLFITNILKGKKLPVYGSGSNIRDWLHVDDHCRGVHAVLTRGQSGEIYNIGGGRELTNFELAKLIVKEMGKDESLISFVTDRPGHDFRYSVDIRKITSELGYEPMVRFEEGIAETIHWYVQNEKWWALLKKNL